MLYSLILALIRSLSNDSGFANPGMGIFFSIDQMSDEDRTYYNELRVSLV